MTKTLTALATAATIGVAAIAAPAPAQARGGWWIPGAVIGGIAAGAIIAGAANPYYYGPGPYYYGPGPYYGPGCVIRRHRVWDGYGAWRWERVRVCY